MAPDRWARAITVTMVVAGLAVAVVGVFGLGFLFAPRRAFEPYTYERADTLRILPGRGLLILVGDSSVDTVHFGRADEQVVVWQRTLLVGGQQ